MPRLAMAFHSEIVSVKCWFPPPRLTEGQQAQPKGALPYIQFVSPKIRVETGHFGGSRHVQQVVAPDLIVTRQSQLAPTLIPRMRKLTVRVPQLVEEIVPDHNSPP